MSTISFTPQSTAAGARLGALLVARGDEESRLEVATPGFLAVTSRGAVPHLSRDHVLQTEAICGMHVSYESFLEQIPAVPPEYPSSRPLHDFLAYPAAKYILALTLHDPADGRRCPPNENSLVAIWTGRGVRRVAPASFHADALRCRVDIIEAVSDVPRTAPPFSQRRLTRSIERTASWLADLLKQIAVRDTHEQPGVLVQMAGCTSIEARKAFARAMVEVENGHRLVDGVLGFAFDLAHLRSVLDSSSVVLDVHASAKPETTSSLGMANESAATHNTSGVAIPALHPETGSTAVENGIVASVSLHENASLNSASLELSTISRTTDIHPLAAYLDASLGSLPATKLRVARGTQSPRDVLLLVRAGIDLFDARWAQDAASIGVALDFIFPAPTNGPVADLGRNLYDTRYAHDHTPVSSSFSSCSCLACGPRPPSSILSHAFLADDLAREASDAAYSRAYIHHLLHTHEMSAHALLAAHNLSVLDAFFSSIRSLLSQSTEAFDAAVAHFVSAYDHELQVIKDARIAWHEVDLARGKGRLAREKERARATGEVD